MMNFIKSLLLNKLYFLKVQELDLTNQDIEEFNNIYDRLIHNGEGKEFSYDSIYPKYVFLNYIIENKDVLVLGSNHTDIKVFQPREQTLFNGKPTKAVFASSDALWSTFFAIINRSAYLGSLRNACLTNNTKRGIKRYYYFSLSNNFAGNRWVNGTIYFLPKPLFKRGGIKD
ncbi:hypothetical protein [Peribacillus acanthi]|uniref:hypothetical protein n=1 Tax=Peribacillus acanthi TaxID=2171554 RepID=UPI00130019C1|nr:hypothetical protein [Peribacillus acanthi]